MKKVVIEISNLLSYPVYIGEDVFSNLYTLIKKHKLYPNIFSVIDTNVFRYHRKKIEELFSKFSTSLKYILIEADEKQKSLESLKKIYSELLKNGYGRDTLLLSIGGGITGDISGFAAATYNRGIQYIQIPTTFLSAVDSSIGGKTGINVDGIKNSVGAFYHPQFILIDSEFFYTLPSREILCGVGEIIKYGFLSDEKFYNYIFRNLEELFQLNNEIILKIIFDSVKFKRDVVAADEKEKSLRKILNLGHTFAHALETEQKFRIKHGAAVVVGIACSLFLSNKFGLLKKKIMENYLSGICQLSDRITIKKYDKEKIYSILQHDKKNINQKIKFVLLKEIGKLVLDVEASKEDIFYALEEGIKLFNRTDN